MGSSNKRWKLFVPARDLPPMPWASLRGGTEAGVRFAPAPASCGRAGGLVRDVPSDSRLAPKARFASLCHGQINAKASHPSSLPCQRAAPSLMHEARWLALSQEVASLTSGHRKRSDALHLLGRPTFNILRTVSPSVVRSLSTSPKEDKAPAQKTHAGALAQQSWLGQKWVHFKHELHHYWVGTKLLGTEIKICVGILRQILRGESLTRREYRQLRTTAADVLKMVPFVVIVIVPFLEFALPLILYFFPNMLPSTFQQQLKKEDDMKRQLKARIEVAKFLQDTVETMGIQVEEKVRHQSHVVA